MLVFCHLGIGQLVDLERWRGTKWLWYKIGVFRLAISAILSMMNSVRGHVVG